MAPLRSATRLKPKSLGGATRKKERGHCQVQRGRKSASSTQAVGSRWGIALPERSRRLLYRSPPNSASSPTRLSPPVSDGEARAKVSQLYPSRVQSVGHSSSRAHKAPAVWVAAQHRFKADAATPPVSGGETRAEGSALAGEASHPPRGLSRAVRRLTALRRVET